MSAYDGALEHAKKRLEYYQNEQKRIDGEIEQAETSLDFIKTRRIAAISEGERLKRLIASLEVASRSEA